MARMLAHCSDGEQCAQTDNTVRSYCLLRRLKLRSLLRALVITELHANLFRDRFLQPVAERHPEIIILRDRNTLL